MKNTTLAVSSFIFLLAFNFAAGQDPAKDTSAADSLRDEGVELFRAGRYAQAGLKYEEAIKAYDEALGKDSPAGLEKTVVLARAVCWCRAQAGDFGALKDAFEAAFARLSSQGGNEGEEGSLHECFTWSLDTLAKKKRADDLAVVFEAYRSALEKASGGSAAKKPGAPEPFLGRLKARCGLSLHDYADRLPEAGSPDRRKEVYTDWLGRFQKLGDHENAAWCRAKLGDFNGLRGDFEAFYKAALEAGGQEPGLEASVRSCVSWCLGQLAAAKDEKGAEKLYRAYEEVLVKTLKSAKKDKKKAAALEPFIGRTEENVANAGERYFQVLFIAGNATKGKKEYENFSKFWLSRKNTRQVCWVPQNAFYALGRAGLEDQAAYFLVETLDKISKHRIACVEASLSVNLRNHLGSLSENDQPEAAVEFLESALAAAGEKKVFGPGMDEIYFRSCLARFLWNSGDWKKGLANGEAIAAQARKAGQAWRESGGDFEAGRALCKMGDHEIAVLRLDSCLQKALEAGDLLRAAYAGCWKGEALNLLGKHEEAEQALSDSLERFGDADCGVGLNEARKAGLRNAKAQGDEDLIEKYKALLRGVSARGGLGGLSLGKMKAAELFKRSSEAENPIDVMAVYREGDLLVFKNLLDNETVTAEITYRFRFVNVSGVLFQVRGAEIAICDITDSSRAPGTQGETGMAAGEESIVTGPDFSPFHQRHLADTKGIVKVTSSLQLLRAAK